MKNTSIILVCLLCMCTKLFAQNATADELIDKGNQQFDKGELITAITYYRQALKKDSNSVRAYYEMANTCIALEKYQEASDYADKVINADKQFADQAYTLKGTALDMMKRPYEALEVYLEGLKKYPDNNLLQYNTALIYLNQKRYPDAEYHAIKAIQANIHHPSSHMVLAYAMYFQGKRVQSLMSIYYFLLLENSTSRSAGALNLLNNQMAQGVSKEGETKINISVSKMDVEDEFNAVELMLSMAQALKYDEKNKDKTDQEKFFDQTKLYFDVLTELKNKNKDKNIWWQIYVPFFRDINKLNYTETFCYYVSQTTKDKVADKWLTDNKTKVDQLLNWYDKRK